MMNAEASNRTDEPFPLEWTAWRALWREWIGARLADGTLTRSSYRFPPPNFLADEVLGVFGVPRGDGSGRTVELSEVTFPALDGSRRDARYVGITFGAASGIEPGGVARTFAELETVLGIDV